jgi:DNA repair protein RecO (recombination protein O)
VSGIEGIVIRVYPSGDSDLVLRIITRERGKLSAIAKHARKSRKRFSSGFDIFDRGTFELREGRGSLATVSSFIPQSSFHRLRAELDKLTAASVACECFDLLIKDETRGEEDYYEIINLGLKAIEDASDLREILRSVYALMIGVMNFSGNLPEDFDPQPSAHNLTRLVALLERVSEKELSSRNYLFELVNRLRKTS